MRDTRGKAGRPPMVMRVAFVTTASTVIWLLIPWPGEVAYAGLSDDVRHTASAVTVFALAQGAVQHCPGAQARGPGGQ